MLLIITNNHRYYTIMVIVGYAWNNSLSRLIKNIGNHIAGLPIFYSPRIFSMVCVDGLCATILPSASIR